MTKRVDGVQTRSQKKRNNGVESALELLRKAREKRPRKSDPPVNRCVECGVDMGDGNPRQLCGKTRCLNEDDLPIQKHDTESESASSTSESASSTSESSGETSESSEESRESTSEVSDNIQESDIPPELVAKIHRGAQREMYRNAPRAAASHDVPYAGDIDEYDIVGMTSCIMSRLNTMIDEGMSPELAERVIRESADGAKAQYKMYQRVYEAVYDRILTNDNMSPACRAELKRLKMEIQRSQPSIERILSLETTDKKKRELVELYAQLVDYPLYSETYNDLKNIINDKIAQVTRVGRRTIRDIIETGVSSQQTADALTDAVSNVDATERLQLSILGSELSVDIKTSLIEELYNTGKSGDGEQYANTRRWINTWLKMPTRPLPPPVPDLDTSSLRKFEHDTLAKFDEMCYGLQHVKERILDYVFCKLQNEDSVMPVLALVGEAGVGKTNLAECIAAAFRRPLIRVKFGGKNDATMLVGSNRHWVGSGPGILVREMQRAGCTNPVILLDEIDKVGVTGHGGDPIGALLHAFDSYRNNFTDEYLEHDIDLSGVVWVCTLNHLEYIDPILRNRMEIVDVPPYTLSDKIAIVRRFFIPHYSQKLHVDKDSVVMDDAVIRHIIEYSGSEAGMRGVRKTLQALYARVTRQRRTGVLPTPFTVTKNWFDEQMETIGTRRQQSLSYYA